MEDEKKTQKQLINELLELRQRSTELEASEIALQQAQERIGESEEKFRSIFESVDDCMVYLDRSGRILEVNEKAVQVFGGSKEELMGKHFAKVEVVSPRDIPMLVSGFASALAGKKPTVYVCINSKKGQEIHLDCSTTVVKRDDQLAGVILMARDITERKRAGEALRESEEKYGNIVETAPDGIVTVNLKGIVTSCNSAFTDITGFSKSEIVGKHFSRLPTLRARDIPKYTRLLNSLIRGGDTAPGTNPGRGRWL